MSLTDAERLEKAKLLYDRLLDESIEEYSEEETRVRKKRMDMLLDQIEKLEQRAARESSVSAGMPRYNDVYLIRPEDE